jgi:hypothetical protein
VLPVKILQLLLLLVICLQLLLLLLVICFQLLQLLLLGQRDAHGQEQEEGQQNAHLGAIC